MTEGGAHSKAQLPGERQQNKELVSWLRELIPALQFSWDFPALLLCLVAKGGDRDLKADAAGCQKSNQAIYTHLGHPGVGAAEPEGGFWWRMACEEFPNTQTLARPSCSLMEEPTGHSSCFVLVFLKP